MAKKVYSLLVFVLIVSSFFGTTVIKTLGGWDSPPLYNGTPYAPGGVGAAKNYIFGTLATFLPSTNEFEPYLAESWKVEGNKFIVELKEGFYWDDGIPFTSKDVKATFIIGGGLRTWSNIWDSLDSIDTPDDYTVIFNLNENRNILVTPYILTEYLRIPYHLFEKWLQPAEEIIMLRKEYDAKKKESGENKIEYYENTISEKLKAFQDSYYAYKLPLPVGIGPFKVVKVTADTMLLEKVDKYPGNIEFDQVEIGKEGANEVRWALIMAGELDIHHPSTPPDVVSSILQKQPKVRHITVPDFSSFALVMNQRSYPFSDVRFRQALAYIIDRDKVRQLSNYYGTTIKYLCGVLPSTINSWVDTKVLNPYDKDLDKAANLLKEMGFEKDKKGFWCDNTGKKLEFEVAAPAETSDWILAAEEISRQLTDFGISCTVRILQNPIYDGTLINGDYDMAIVFSSAGSKMHPFQGFARFYLPTEYITQAVGGSTKVKGPDGETLDLTVLTKQLSTTWDLETQKKIISQLAWATNEYLPFIDFLEKQLQLFICDGIRVTGWPFNDSKFYDQLAFDYTTAVVRWIADGTLKPVR